ncbi:MULTISPECIES: ABC transporter ATP-binding protein [unclassified Rhizobium]|uniref:ABC transporter ATP-binding protein n=1 Tax=unclassified Rhizobium TaxID=2613769 RepID=UPI001046ABAE|nr:MULTISPECIES: ABC transporter ATP-binding protein [unclassified Rhizobium]MBB3394989.1 branched-chain amino acid transport system ATP-binding protein [Rhizobium sp. BK060]MBB4167411.1 branched-chain amino acid transport system ATP-binding protein [Rhizobium sp. BK538]TCM78588.1 amino acid/amide ABC transporter ATP-binding protein 2 (HAAT family) [Rhizobium sp. BK068]
MPLLETHALTASYGDFQALFGIDIRLEEGETLAIIGANGAGKTTLMRSLSGVLKNEPGSISYRGEAIGALDAPDVMSRGIAMVPEGRRLFPSLSVEENLLIGSYGRKATGSWTLESIYALFPVLKERRRNSATALSGGQQQMVAIGRALMSNPDVLLCDEISLGLAPVVVRDIYAAFPRIRETGAAIIIVEQDIAQALKVSNRIYCMMEGRITLAGKPCDLDRDAIHKAYFGADGHELA